MILFFISFATAQTITSNITTFAKNISSPTSLTVDISGTLYVADTNNHLIRKITSAGTVSTLAGNGSSGFVNGQGTSAKFNFPTGVAVDTSGNIYVADSMNHAIRKITSSGLVTTLAGGSTSGYVDAAGLSARFNTPYDITFDLAGYLYVTDSGNYRIRRVTLNGVVTTVAGSGSMGNVNGVGTAASFGILRGITTDTYSNIYVCDNSNHRIQKITPGKVVTTIAGSSSGYADGSGANALFWGPEGISVDTFGNIFIADTLNQRIRRLDASGQVTTYAGNGTEGFVNGIGASATFRNLSGLTSDIWGHVYIADKANNAIRKANLPVTVSTIAGKTTTGNVDGASNVASFNTPIGLAVDSNGVIYVGDNSNLKIRRVYQNGTTSTFVSSLRKADGISLHSNGSLFTVSNLYSEFCRVDPSGVFTKVLGLGSGFVDGTISLAMVYSPYDVTVSGDEIFIVDTRNYKIRKISGNTVSTVTNTTSQPYYITLLTNGSFYFTASGLYKMDSSGQKTLVTTALTNEPITSDKFGNLYYDSVYKIQILNPWLQTSVFAGMGVAGVVDGDGGVAKFNDIKYLTFDSDGAMYVSHAHMIRKIITPTRNISYCPAGYEVSQTTFQCIACGIGYYKEFAGAIACKLCPSGYNSTTTGSTKCDETVMYQVKTFWGDGSCSSNALWSITKPGCDMTVGGTCNTPTTCSSDLYCKGNCTSDPTSYISANLKKTYVTVDFYFNDPSCTANVGYSLSAFVGQCADKSMRAYHLVDGTLQLDFYYGAVGGCNSTISYSTVIDPTQFGTCLSGPYITARNEEAFIKVTLGASPTSPRVIAVSGSGTSGSINNGTNSTFNSPTSLTVDISGTLYVADTNNHLIRKITSAGTVSTLAGNGSSGFVNGQGTSAKFNFPTGVAVDTSGNIYVADSMNHAIRKISNSGLVTTLAGSSTSGYVDAAGLSARFNTPYDITFDLAGYLYVTDSGNYRIRRVTLNGVVTTVAGSGSMGNVNGVGTAASFGILRGITTDTYSNIYVCDNSNHRIQKITPGKVVTTIAGSSSGYADDSGANALFWGPEGISVDTFGNIFIADTLNQRIRRLDASGQVTTYAGNGTEGFVNGIGASATFRNLSGLTSDIWGHAYIADKANNAIRKANLPVTVSTIAGKATSGDADGGSEEAMFNNPIGLAADPNGVIYVGDNTNMKVKRVYQNGTTSTFVSSLRYPEGISLHSNGSLFTINKIDSELCRVDPTNVLTKVLKLGGGFVDGTISLAKFSYGSDLVLSGDDIYFPDTYNYKIRKISGNIVSTVTTTTSYPYYINRMANGSFYFTASGLYKMDGAGQKTLVTSALTNEPITSDKFGNLYYDSLYKIQILNPWLQTSVFAGMGVAGVVDGDGGVAKFNDIKYLTFDSDGAMYVSHAHMIRKIITPTRNISYCPAGYEVSQTTFQCTACGIGYYKEFAGATACKLCPSGYNSTTTGSTKCNETVMYQVQTFWGDGSCSSNALWSITKPGCNMTVGGTCNTPTTCSSDLYCKGNCTSDPTSYINANLKKTYVTVDFYFNDPSCTANAGYSLSAFVGQCADKSMRAYHLVDGTLQLDFYYGAVGGCNSTVSYSRIVTAAEVGKCLAGPYITARNEEPAIKVRLFNSTAFGNTSLPTLTTTSITSSVLVTSTVSTATSTLQSLTASVSGAMATSTTTTVSGTSSTSSASSPTTTSASTVAVSVATSTTTTLGGIVSSSSVRSPTTTSASTVAVSVATSTTTTLGGIVSSSSVRSPTTTSASTGSVSTSTTTTFGGIVSSSSVSSPTTTSATTGSASTSTTTTVSSTSSTNSASSPTTTSATTITTAFAAVTSSTSTITSGTVVIGTSSTINQSSTTYGIPMASVMTTTNPPPIERVPQGNAQASNHAKVPSLSPSPDKRPLQSQSANNSSSPFSQTFIISTAAFGAVLVLIVGVIMISKKRRRPVRVYPQAISQRDTMVEGIKTRTILVPGVDPERIQVTPGKSPGKAPSKTPVQSPAVRKIDSLDTLAIKLNMPVLSGMASFGINTRDMLEMDFDELENYGITAQDHRRIKNHFK